MVNTALARPAQRLPDDVRDILRLATYQLAFLDRVPPHAVVDTAVEATKKAGHPRHAGMVNAVLRTLSKQIPAAPASTLAEEWSHPDWLVQRWVERFGNDRTAEMLAHHNRRPPTYLQVVPGHEDELLQALASQGVEHSRISERVLQIEGGSLATLPGYEEGWFYAQDVTQQRLISHAGIPEGQLVWDACAAPGGKTMALAPVTPVVASDRKASRLRRLRANVGRLRIPVPMFVADLSQPPLAMESVPVVLVDAPCSGTGTFARHPDARWRVSPEEIQRLAAQQTRLLSSAAQVVQRGGRLVYLTCSVEPEENGEQVERFLSDNKDFERAVPDLEVLPGANGGDGGFVASLLKRP